MQLILVWIPDLILLSYSCKLNNSRIDVDELACAPETDLSGKTFRV